tara:strand:+ start:2238 stop:3656 length:1419 start_codon:yes stop_codon:yes gene_type:complete
MASQLLDPNRLFPADGRARAIAQHLYQDIKDLPIISPHGHTDPQWYAENNYFPDAAELFLMPDHYIFRMLYSQGIPMEDMGVPRVDGGPVETDKRKIWRLFAEHFYLFRGTPSSLWLAHVFHEVFGIDKPFGPDTADYYFDYITESLQTDAYRPRSLMDRFNIEVIATTEGATDPLAHHKSLSGSAWAKRVITTFRPDDVVDPERKGFLENIETLAMLTGEDTHSWSGYLGALRQRRADFRACGATATDHGHPTAATADLSAAASEALFHECLEGNVGAEKAELFRAQMITEMAKMSIDDGMILQIHAGARRNYNQDVFARFGSDKGADIPSQTNFVDGLKPLLDRYGNEPALSMIAFTLDEDTYSRELAPLAGHFPCLKLGPPWWFFDSPEGMIRYRERVTETAGFYNTVGFNDDTRAFLSIPARHDVARRMDCRFLGTLIAEGRMTEEAGAELAYDLTYRLAKESYNLCD